jgi:hypothetical protein
MCSQVVMRGTSDIMSYLRRVLKARETRTLELSFLDLTSFPCEYLGITSVTDLSLSDNNLASLSPEIGTCVDLKQLWLQNNKLTTLPPSVRSLTKLVTLCLDNNRLDAVPPLMRYLTAMRRLSLKDNTLDEIPAALADLERLEVLTLDGNKLYHFPEIFHRWTALKELTVSNNRIAELQLQFEVLSTLEVLNLEGNLLVSPPREVLKQGTPLTLEYIKRLKVARETKVLDLCSFGLRVLPVEVIKNNSRLRELKLSDNNMKVLPADIRMLHEMELLMCDKNVLTEVSACVCLFNTRSVRACVPYVLKQALTSRARSLAADGAELLHVAAAAGCDAQRATLSAVIARKADQPHQPAARRESDPVAAAGSQTPHEHHRAAGEDHAAVERAQLGGRCRGLGAEASSAGDHPPRRGCDPFVRRQAPRWRALHYCYTSC